MVVVYGEVFSDMIYNLCNIDLFVIFSMELVIIFLVRFIVLYRYILVFVLVVFVIIKIEFLMNI